MHRADSLVNNSSSTYIKVGRPNAYLAKAPATCFDSILRCSKPSAIPQWLDAEDSVSDTRSLTVRADGRLNLMAAR